MKQNATGFLELNNLASAIESADQMLKAANLDFIKQIKIGPQSFALLIKGDAPSVEAALIAGEASAKRSGSFLVSQLVKDLDPAVEQFIFQEALQ
jgi:microcompartment protein CcmL/EutN